MACTSEHLYQLLPAIYRIRDAELGQPLRALIAVIAEQAAVVEEDMGRLYENWFIETCDEWAVPYIGDLLGVRGLHQVTDATFSQRGRVANTLSYRRRKGTASMLEQLARDTTGWPARVVECFQQLATTQHINHVRPQNLRTPDLRRAGVLDVLGSPFDTIPHTVDVRHIDIGRGIHNIMNVGVYFWRLQASPIFRAPAFPHADGLFSFSQLGQDLPLFTHPATEPDPSHLAEEINVPAPIRRLALKASLESNKERYYGSELSFRIWEGANEIERHRIVACNLDGWRHRPAEDHVAVDPVLGRIAFPAGHEHNRNTVHVEYYYGASGEVGGGCYERELLDQTFVLYRVSKTIPAMNSIRKAIDRWTADGSPNAVVEIQDNEIYQEALTIVIPAGTSLEIRARNQGRPVVRLTAPLSVTGAPPTDPGQPGGALILDGLLVTGQPIDILKGDLGGFELRHCTLVPGRALTPQGTPAAPGEPSLIVAAANERLGIVVTRSICGSLRMQGMGTLTIVDSLVDGTGGPAIRAGTLVIRESTVFGRVAATLIENASNAIFTDPVTAERKQAGCVRFCYLPPTSDVPRRYQCQPDAAVAQAIEAASKTVGALTTATRNAIRAELRGRLRPSFSDLRYGQPGYGQLDQRCPVEIKTGADDQAEMGVFHHLKQAQRESNFRTSLDEYLRVGLEAGLVNVT
jgi:hypothetical protein